MACCGKKNLNIPTNQQKIINVVKNKQQIPNSAVKSNRSRPGYIAKQCPNCGTKSIFNICPICSYKFS
jgi:hypothetical protein